MKYPGVVLKGRNARGEVLSIALANDKQHQDTGAKMIHLADDTSSNIISKSISIGKGRSTYRGQVHMPKHLKNCKNNTECDALRLTLIAEQIHIQQLRHEETVIQFNTKQVFLKQVPNKFST